jgi:opacity protein-like surface antigen
MRLVTIGATLVVAVSTAALAQVVRDPVEHKNAPANTTVVSNGAGGASATSDAAANEHDAATPSSGKTEPAAPKR